MCLDEIITSKVLTSFTVKTERIFKGEDVT